MAQLKDLLVAGPSRFIGDMFGTNLQITKINAPTAAGGAAYGVGSAGQALCSNGTSVYWGYPTAGSQANLVTTANSVAYFTNTTGTFAAKPSANGVLYATSANGALQWGILPIAQGGTGKTSARDAANVLLNGLETGASTPVDADYYISQYVGGGTTTTTYHRRPMSALWSYIDGKITANRITTATQYGVAYYSSTTKITSTAAGTAGYPLIGAGSAAPIWYGGQVNTGTAAASWKTTFNGTTASTTTATGAVVISGGLGVGNRITASEINATRPMVVSAGKVYSNISGSNVLLPAKTSMLFSDGVAFATPGLTVANDVGWIRMLGTSEADGVLEIATGDDGGTANGEAIVARQYNTSNVITHEATLLAKQTGATSFPVSVTTPIVQATGTTNSTSSTTGTLIVSGGIGAAGGLAAGAAIGSALGPAGTAIGAVVGGLIGLFGGGSAGYAVGDATWSSDAYAKELAQQDKYKKKALGSIGPEGIVSSQYGTSMSDNVPTLLSPGEMVMNAKATQEHLPQLKAWNQDKVKHYSGGTTEDDIKNTLIKASEEQTKPMQVNPVESSMMGAGNMAIEPLTINPITINVSGTINLTGGGGTASLNIKDLINDNTFVSLLTRELERTMNHSFNAGETKSHMPFYIPPMSMA